MTMTATPIMLAASANSVRRSAGSLSQKMLTRAIHMGAVYWRKTALAAEPMAIAVTYRAFMAAKQMAVGEHGGTERNVAAAQQRQQRQAGEEGAAEGEL